MCDFSGKLIAWMDRELPAEQAAEVESHIEACPECRGQLDAYMRVSGGIEAYCDETMTSSGPRGTGIPLLAPAISVAAALAIIVAFFFTWSRTRVEPRALQSSQSAVVASPFIAAENPSASARPIEHLHRQQVVTPAGNFSQGRHLASTAAQTQIAGALPEESMIRIAIPAEEMFPPGAVPEGMNFVADVTIAPDGSAERMRLRPQLAAFERSTSLQ